MVVCVIDQAGYGATAAAPVVRDIYSYLATHPIGPAAIPPPATASRSSTPVPLPVLAATPGATTTTTTTTLPG